MNKGIGKYVWTWILIFCFLTPQFSYNAEAKNIFKKITDEVNRAVTNVHDAVEKNVIRPLAQTFVPGGIRSTWDHSVGKGIKEVGRAGHKVEKYTIRPVSDPRLIGKVAAIAIVAYFCPPAWGTLAGAGGILAAGATSATYDRVVLNVHNGGDLTKSFLTAAGSAAVTAAFDNYIPVKKEVVDPVTGVKTEVILLSNGEQYLRGVAMSVSHIAVGQATSLIVDGKGTLGGRAWSGAFAGAFVPSVQLVTDNNLVATLVDPINRSVVEQSVVNRFNMKKVDFGAAVTSGAMALRDQYVREKATEFAKFAKNWYESKQMKSIAQGEIDADKDDLGMGDNPAINNDGSEEHSREPNSFKDDTDSSVNAYNLYLEDFCKDNDMVPIAKIDINETKYACLMSRPLDLPLKIGEALYFGSDNIFSIFRHDLWVVFEKDHPIKDNESLYSPNDKMVGDYGFHAAKGGVKGPGEVAVDDIIKHKVDSYYVKHEKEGRPICYRIESAGAVLEAKKVEWDHRYYKFAPGNSSNCKGFAEDVKRGITCTEWQEANSQIKKDKVKFLRELDQKYGDGISKIKNDF